MTSSIDALLPSAKELMDKIALAEADEAEKQARARSEADVEKKALIDQLSKPSGVSDEEAIRRGLAIIQRAVNSRLTEVQVFQFPSQLCTDKGRAINQQEPGWEKTLTGAPKEIYQLWEKYFRPRGYRLRVQIVEFPGGLPGDVAMTLSWGRKEGL
jgi:predicted RNA polymerase sigma factor